ncbi:MAG: hypothetical protein BWY57_02143 [Betaproteobacteria bacterium ADurb.Bin341]|nr:MAG: hypothetical protein BWY57_02143 [Betaproteobacteria bacterium ADurb.Bin341]
MDILLCLVIAISDGDTLRASRRPKETIKIRLAEIDVLEKEKLGQRSKQSLSDLCYLRQAKITTRLKAATGARSRTLSVTVPTPDFGYSGDGKKSLAEK